jgi:hypothetical protein
MNERKHFGNLAAFVREVGRLHQTEAVAIKKVKL